jgi:nicotinamidase-related amidase
MNGISPRLEISPNSTALLIIDVQRALFSRPTPIYRADDLIRNINSLVEIWQRHGGLIIYIQHSNNKMLVKNTNDWQFHPGLKKKKTDHVVHKVHGNAFEKTNLKELLESRGIESIVVTGLVTHGCVRATCIGGHRLGYRVILVEDGHSNYNKDAGKIIKDWNQKLSREAVELISVDGIDIQQ